MNDDRSGEEQMVEQAKRKTPSGAWALVQLLGSFLTRCIGRARKHLNGDIARRQDAEDVGQAAVLRGLIDRSKMRARTKSGVRAWFRRVFHRITLNIFRRDRMAAKRSVDLEQPLTDQDAGQLQDKQPTPSGQVEAKLDLEKAYRLLPQEEREALELRYTRGLSAAQIAVRLGTSERTVNRRLEQAIAHMRQTLGVPSEEKSTDEYTN